VKEGYLFKGWHRVLEDGTLESEAFDFDTPITSNTSLKAKFLTPWQDLQEQIDAAPNGGTVALTGDTKAIQEDIPLHVPEGKSIILDLAGHTLDANNHSFAISVLYESSALTLKDSSSAKTGKVTGTSEEALYVESGSITLESGSISGNKVRGVYVNGGSFTMTGGTITGNGSEDGGGGVFVNGAFNLSGSASITGNTSIGSSALNVILYAGRTINIAGALTDGAKIGVTMAHPGVFTSGFKAKMGENADPANFFTSDDGDWVVRLTEDGEAALMQWKNITIDQGDKLDAVTVKVNDEAVTAANDGKYKAFPGDTVSVTATAMDGYAFDGITVKDALTTAELAVTNNTFTMSDNGVTVTVNFITEWKALQKAIEKGGDIKVSDLTGADKTIRDDANEGRLVVKTPVVLDLDGCVIDRARTNPEGDGGVFYVYSGNLEMKDSANSANSIITGGWTTGQGGSVLVEGGGNSFTLSGGTIRDNQAYNGGGVFVNESGSFTMTGGAKIENNKANTTGGVKLNKATFIMNGGAITGNIAKVDCGGVSVPVNSVFELSGAVDISGNTDKDGASNVQLEYGTKTENSDIYVTGGLTTENPIGVRYIRSSQAPEPLVFTKKLKGKGTAENFTSDDPHYLVGVNKDGEAYLCKVVIVTFDANGGSEVQTQNVLTGDKATEPEAPTRAGYLFKGWHLLVEGTPAEDTFDFGTGLDTDITLQAKWVTPWQDLQNQIDAAQDGDTITLSDDVTFLKDVDNGPITVSADKKITIDLAGHAIDRALSAAKADGNAITVKGSLTVTDSGNSGKIKGGNSNGRGGGVFVDGGSFTLNGGAITGNKATYGGGVQISSGTFAMNGGSVSGNEATYGGGVLHDGTG